MSRLIDDVQDLLKDATIEEGVSKVWAQFSTAFEALDPASRLVLEKYFNGSTVSELSKELDLSQEATKAVVDRAKRELIQNVKLNSRVRQ